MPSLGDSAFIFVLALLLFGPKKLPELARQLGKLMGEFRRASNEFRMQMEDELRITEQADRQKEIAAIQAAAPVTPAIDPTPANSIGGPSGIDGSSATSAEALPADLESPLPPLEDPLDSHPHMISRYPTEELAAEPIAAPQSEFAEAQPAPPASSEPLPIATSGSLTMRPPKTGMPYAQGRSDVSTPLSPLFDAIPHAAAPESLTNGSNPLTPAAKDSEGREGTLASTEATHHG